LVASKDSQILDLVPAGAAAVCTIVADQRSVTEEKEVRIGIEKRATSVASEAVEMPAVTSKFESFPFLENLSAALARQHIVIVC
jgi:hypothetical protein